MSWLLLLVWATCWSPLGSGQEQGLPEYVVSECYGDIFNFDCGPGNKIRINKDFFGHGAEQECRYSPGHCIISNPKSNSLIHRFCTGHRVCTYYLVERRGCDGLFSNYQQVEYQCIPDSMITDVCSGGSYEAVSTYIASPNFPENYPPNLNCRCVVSAISPEAKVQLEIVYLAIKYSSPCRDWLRVGRRRSCGINVELFQGRVIPIEFHSDQDDSHSGFWLHFQSSVPGEKVIVRCGNVSVNAAVPTRTTTPVPTTTNTTSRTPVGGDTGRSISTPPPNEGRNNTRADGGPGSTSRQGYGSSSDGANTLLGDLDSTTPKENSGRDNRGSNAVDPNDPNNPTTGGNQFGSSPSRSSTPTDTSISSRGPSSTSQHEDGSTDNSNISKTNSSSTSSVNNPNNSGGSLGEICEDSDSGVSNGPSSSQGVGTGGSDFEDKTSSVTDSDWKSKDANNKNINTGSSTSSNVTPKSTVTKGSEYTPGKELFPSPRWTFASGRPQTTLPPLFPGSSGSGDWQYAGKPPKPTKSPPKTNTTSDLKTSVLDKGSHSSTSRSSGTSHEDASSSTTSSETSRTGSTNQDSNDLDLTTDQRGPGTKSDGGTSGTPENTLPVSTSTSNTDSDVSTARGGGGPGWKKDISHDEDTINVDYEQRNNNNIDDTSRANVTGSPTTMVPETVVEEDRGFITLGLIVLCISIGVGILLIFIVLIIIYCKRKHTVNEETQTNTISKHTTGTSINGLEAEPVQGLLAPAALPNGPAYTRGVGHQMYVDAETLYARPRKVDRSMQVDIESDDAFEYDDILVFSARHHVEHPGIDNPGHASSNDKAVQVMSRRPVNIIYDDVAPKSRPMPKKRKHVRHSIESNSSSGIDMQGSTVQILTRESTSSDSSATVPPKPHQFFKISDSEFESYTSSEAETDSNRKLSIASMSELAEVTLIPENARDFSDSFSDQDWDQKSAISI